MTRTPLLAALACAALLLGMALASSARAGHTQAISITSPLNDSAISNLVNGYPNCHGVPEFFNPSYGWARTCGGAYDVGNAYSSANVYLRGYWWTSATVAGVRDNPVYYACGQNPAGTEYGNAFTTVVQTGTAGAGFHHMDNYHYAFGATVLQGAHVGEQANWGGYVYYCPGGALASTAPHIHWEAARDGSPDDSYLLDTWGWYSGYTAPYVNFRHP